MSRGGLPERRERARRATDVRRPEPLQRPSEAVRSAKGRNTAALISAVPAAALVAWSVQELTGGHGALGLAGLAVTALWLLLTFPWAHGGRAGSGFTGLSGMLRVRAVRRAMQHDELELQYQPQVDLATGTPYGVEALLRWRRNGALVPPGDFLPAVEGSDLIVPLTERVIEMATAQAASWRAGGRELRVAVNLSAENLRDFRVVSQLERALAANDLPPDALMLEVTETTVLDNPEQTRAVLDAIDGL